MTGAYVTGHVVCGLGLITACVSTAATSSTRFSLIPKNSGDSSFSINPAGFSRGQSSLLIFIVSAVAAGAWLWCILLFSIGTLPAHIVAGISSKVILLAKIWHADFPLANRIPIIPVLTALACLFLAAFLYEAALFETKYFVPARVLTGFGAICFTLYSIVSILESGASKK